MSEAEKYKALYEKYIKYENKTHEKNQAKIKNGLKVNILLPLVFLIISFATNSSKLIFLILWIASLFGIAFYLMYVEYSDYKMQKLLASLEAGDELDSLIGSNAVVFEEVVTDKIDEIDEKIEESKAATREKIGETLSAIGEKSVAVTSKITKVVTPGTKSDKEEDDE